MAGCCHHDHCSAEAGAGKVLNSPAWRRALWIALAVNAVMFAVLAAAAGVFGTGAGWPDLIVAAVMASLSISGGWQIVRQARGELQTPAPQTT